MFGASQGHLGQSLWLREIAGREDGAGRRDPPVDLQQERAAGELVRRAIASGKATAVHDGGRRWACRAHEGFARLAEMALAGGIGAAYPLEDLTDAATAFGEDQGRYVITAAMLSAKELSLKDGQSEWWRIFDPESVMADDP